MGRQEPIGTPPVFMLRAGTSAVTTSGHLQAPLDDAGGDGEKQANRNEGQRVTVLAVAELELALEVGTPQIVGRRRRRQRRALDLEASPLTGALHEAVTVLSGQTEDRRAQRT